jgi:hypothetical protein
MVRKDVPHELRALREPQGYLAELIKMPRTVSWDILGRPCGTVLLQERINPLNAFAGSANAFVGASPHHFRPRYATANLGHPSVSSAVQRIPMCSFALPVRRARSCLQRLAARLLLCKGEM